MLPVTQKRVQVIPHSVAVVAAAVAVVLALIWEQPESTGADNPARSAAGLVAQAPEKADEESEPAAAENAEQRTSTTRRRPQRNLVPLFLPGPGTQ